MIESAYSLAEGKPFTIDTPGKSSTMVTSSHHIRELDRAPRSMLSLHAVAKEVTLSTLLLAYLLNIHVVLTAEVYNARI
jgi:hypothetical protein